MTVSTSGFYPGCGGALYVASKFSVRGCVIALAHEAGPEVRVNGVAPGMNAGHRAHRAAGASAWPIMSWTRRPAAQQDLRRRTPLQVALTREDHRGQLRVPGLGPRPRDHRHRGAHRWWRRR